MTIRHDTIARLKRTRMPLLPLWLTSTGLVTAMSAVAVAHPFAVSPQGATLQVPGAPSPASQSAASQSPAPSSVPPPATRAVESTPRSSTASADASSAIRFSDASAASGLGSIVTTSGETPSTTVLEVKGCGLLAIDFDGDGHMDLFVPNGATLEDTEAGPGARLLRNKGDGTFEDVTAASGITHRRWSYGGSVGDYDGDGRDDIYICCFGPDVLLRNLGGGRFEDATTKAGVGAPGWSAQAAFADLDGDGDLDLFVTRYLDFDPANPQPTTRFKGIEVMSGPKGYPALPDLLYENLGNGTFADRSDASGIRAAKPSFGLAVVVVDMNGDGRPDIFVGNDSQPNQLFVNQGGLKFTEEALRRGIATNMEGGAQATMGTALGDVNADGRPDLLASVFSSDTNTLFVNSPKFFFDDRSSQFGIAAPSRPLLGWAAIFSDFEHDGLEDLIVFNGHVYPQATRATMDSEYEQAPLLMQRQAQRFSAVDGGAALRAPRRDRAAVTADFDGDGDLDIIVAGLNQPLRYLRNDHDGKDDWIVVTLDDRRPGSKNRRGIGAKVEMGPSSAAQPSMVRWLWSGGPFMSNWAPMAHFGVLAADGPFTARVTWPDGRVQTVDGIAPGSRRAIVRTE